MNVICCKLFAASFISTSALHVKFSSSLSSTPAFFPSHHILSFPFFPCVVYICGFTYLSIICVSHVPLLYKYLCVYICRIFIEVSEYISVACIRVLFFPSRNCLWRCTDWAYWWTSRTARDVLAVIRVPVISHSVPSPSVTAKKSVSPSFLFPLQYACRFL